MEPAFQVEVLEDQIRECFGRVVWTHNTHEKCADILHTRNSRLKLAQIALSIVATSGILIAVLGDNKATGLVAAVVSAINAGLSIYVKKHDLGTLAQKHADAATSIWNIRERYFSLLTDIRARLADPETIRALRDQLQSDLHKIYKGSPRTISPAYAGATKALKKMEEMTLSNEEIDRFLPMSLKKIKPAGNASD